MRVLLAAAWLLGGCASANVDIPDNPPDGPPKSGDGPDVDPPDGPNPNPIEATLQQTTNTTVAANNSVACSDFDGNGNVLLTHDNSWYRVYSLAEANITGSFTVSKVTFSVEVANNEPPVTVKVGSYAGTPDDTTPLDLGQANFLATVTTPIANTQTPVSIDAAIAATIPAGSKVIVQITSSDHATNGDGLLLGTTTGPFQHTNYLSSVVCAINVPTTPGNLPGCTGCSASQAIMSVTGTH